MKRYFQLLLVFVLALVTVVTLTSCSSDTVIPGSGETPNTNTPGSGETSTIMTPEDMLKQFEKYGNEVVIQDYLQKYQLKEDEFQNKCKKNITVENADNWKIDFFTACEKQLIKGTFSDIWHYKGVREYDEQNKVTLYGGKTLMDEKMNIKGFDGKVKEEYNFKGGSCIKNNTLYNFDSINNVKEPQKGSKQASLCDTRNNNNSFSKCYVDNDGSVLTIVHFNNSNNIVSIYQTIFGDNTVTYKNYSYINSQAPSFIKSIGADFDYTIYYLNVKTKSYKDGTLTIPNLDSYELGAVIVPQFWG